MDNTQRTKIRNIFKHFGFNNQFDKMIEEFEEYKEAIMIYLSDPTEENLNNVIFEKSDLEIMINQLMYGTIQIKSDIKSNEIDRLNKKATSWKIKRTLERIKSEYYKGDK
jgi:hypothetical protein